MKIFISMKKIMFSLFLSLFMITSSFANTSKVDNVNSIENRIDKTSINIKLGNVTNLSEKQIVDMANSMLEDFVKQNKNSLDECTVTMSAEVSVGVVKVTVSASYTASNCEVASSKCATALGAAVQKAKKAIQSIY